MSQNGESLWPEAARRFKASGTRTLVKLDRSEDAGGIPRRETLWQRGATRESATSAPYEHVGFQICRLLRLAGIT